MDRLEHPILTGGNLMLRNAQFGNNILLRSERKI